MGVVLRWGVAVLALSLATRTRGALLRPSVVLDVHTYGAVGDGETDDGPALEKAFGAAAAASAAGSSVTIRLPAPGVYVLDRPLVLNASNAFLSIESGATLRWRWDKNLSFTDRWTQVRLTSTFSLATHALVHI